MPDLIAERDELRARVDALRLREEVSVLQESLRLREEAERLVDLPEAWGDPVPRDDYPDRDMPDWYSRSGAVASLQDRDDGRFVPVYQTEQDVLRLFALGRAIGSGTAVGTGAIDRLYEFVFGDGLQFEVVAEEGRSVPAGLIAEAQAIVDRFLDDNAVAGGLDRELHRRTREDGEQLVGLRIDGRRILATLYESDQLRTPASTGPLDEWLTAEAEVDGEVSWSFGVASPRWRPDRPLAYHVVCDEHGSRYELLREAEAVHVRRNVPSRAKRGVSDFHAVWRDLMRDDKLTAALGTSAVAIARIVGVRKHEAGTTRSDVTALVGDQAVGTIARQNRTPPGGTRAVPAIPYEGGTILDAGRYDWVNGPLGATNGPNLVLVAQHLRRSIGLRWGMPEYLVSGDASNANYASTTIAAEAWARARKADQRFYGAALEGMLWKVLRLAHGAGWIGEGLTWEQVEVSLRIDTTAPDVSTLDPFVRAQAQALDIQSGTLSRRSAASEAGRDFDAESAAMGKDGDPSPAGAMPGEGPSPAASAAPVAGDVAPTPPEVQDQVLNGAQIAAATGIVGQVARGEIPRDAGIGQLVVLFRLTDAQAERIMGSAGSAVPVTANPVVGAPSAALQGALESVATTDEAREIIESLRREYP